MENMRHLDGRLVPPTSSYPLCPKASRPTTITGSGKSAKVPLSSVYPTAWGTSVEGRLQGVASAYHQIVHRDESNMEGLVLSSRYVIAAPYRSDVFSLKKYFASPPYECGR
jgi:hypothetical protein